MTNLLLSLSKRAGLSLDVQVPFFCMSRSRRWRTTNIESRQESRAMLNATVDQTQPNYKEWTHETLIQRVTELEEQLKVQNQHFTKDPSPKTYKKARSERQFDPSKYSTRLVAFKLAYLGKNYNGFEHHANNPTRLPTIEEELWKAFNKARLIFPKGSHPLRPGEVNWDGCEYSKCGRTDKGVSAFGQVIGIRVRSNRPLPKRKPQNGQIVDDSEGPENLYNTFPRDGALEIVSPALGPPRETDELVIGKLRLDEENLSDALSFDPVADEIPYASLLNRILPPDIRILAWCPAPPFEFSARFSCRERQYKYFFTQPAFAPIPTNLEETPKKDTVKDGWLNIEAMREAAKKYEGVHDFRNFCKIDGSKQLSNFERRIFYSNIEEVDDTTNALSFVNGKKFAFTENLNTPNATQYPKIYSFTLHGSAFLWHQVRHMVAVLFVIGQGLEQPSLVSELLDIESNPCRPTYEMATDTPLVLWNCVFPRHDDEERKEALQWHYVGDGRCDGDAKYGPGGLVEDLWKVWRERKVDEILAGSLLEVIFKQNQDIDTLAIIHKKGGKSQKVFDGGDGPRLQGTYLPVMKKPLMESVEVANNKYAARKGFESSEDMKEQGFKRLKNP